MQAWGQLSVGQQEARLRTLAEAALGAWGLQGEIHLIKQRENAVFEVNASDGNRFALRVHRAGYHSDAELLSEMQWMDALRDSGLAVPTVVPALDGSRFTHVSVPGVPETRQVDLLAWCAGRQLGSIEEALPEDPQQRRRIFETIGATLAKMHNQATRWALPAGFARHAWDADGLVGPQPFWGPFWELAALTDEQRALIGRTRELVAGRLNAIGQSPQTYSLIHADCVPENILVDGDQPQIIDFDDAGFGWHMFDLATVLYFIQGDPGYEDACQALIVGYRSHRNLPDSMLEHLPVFLAARSFTYLGWLHTRKNTRTAQELTPILVQMCCANCEALLNS